jgi:hypothetical protein
VVELLEILESRYPTENTLIARQIALIAKHTVLIAEWAVLLVELERLTSSSPRGTFRRVQDIAGFEEGERVPERTGAVGGGRNSPIVVEDEDNEGGLYSASVPLLPPHASY